jgi:hypothetical protein
MSPGSEQFVLRVLAYFPGKWDIKSADGSTLGYVRWKAEAGGRALTGKGRMRNGSISALAGWDLAKREWIHTLVEESGAFGQIVVTRFKNNTYTGTFYFVDSNGEGETSDWKNEIIDNDHFVISEILKGKKTILHFHRR